MNDEFGIELIDGKMVDIDKLSSKEAEKLLKDIDAKIDKLKKEIDKGLFENTND